MVISVEEDKLNPVKLLIIKKLVDEWNGTSIQDHLAKKHD